jgi:hypothetical protein
MVTHVTGLIASPSTLTIASVSFSMIVTFSLASKTPSMSFTWMRGTWFSLFGLVCSDWVSVASSLGDDVASEELRDRRRDRLWLLDVQEMADARDRALLDVR